MWFCVAWCFCPEGNKTWVSLTLTKTFSVRRAHSCVALRLLWNETGIGVARNPLLSLGGVEDMSGSTEMR